MLMLAAGLAVNFTFAHFTHDSHRSFRQVFITAVLYGIAMGWVAPWTRRIDENRLARRVKK